VFNSPPAVLERWGVGWGQVHAALPDLIVAVVSCYGAEGPCATLQGNGTLAEAFGGLTDLTGEAHGPPMLTSIPLGDTLTAMSGVIGVLTASMARHLGNAGGQFVDIAMYEPILQLLGPVIAEWDGSGEPPKRRGNRLPDIPLRNLYRCSDDKWIAVSATTDRQAHKLLKLAGFSDLEGVASVGDRIARADELEHSVCRWADGHESDAALRLLEQAHVTASPVLDLAQIAAHPHVRARGSLYRANGTFRVAATPRLSQTRGDSSGDVRVVDELAARD
jgi:formyl-CoA transferase